MALVPEYRVLIREVDPDFSPGSVAVELDLHKNLGWSEMVNDVGEAFFTLAQEDPKLDDVVDLIQAEAFVEIHRGEDIVWAGRFAEADETENDVVCYAYAHASELFWLHTDWGAEWSGDQLDVIVGGAWDYGAAKTDSRIDWMTKGTIQAPETVTGNGIEIVLPSYEANYKRLLFLFQEMAGIAQSDTVNHTRFEITPAGTFNFWKNDGTTRDDQQWEYGGGLVAGYHRITTPGDTRSIVLGVGSSPNDVLLRKQASTTTTKGRKEEALFFEWVRDETELNRVLGFRKYRAARVDTQLALSFMPGRITPFRATDANYALFDRVPVRIEHGATDIHENKLVTGQQIILVRGKEHVRVFLQDTLTV